MMLFRTHRALVFAPLVAAVTLITACDDDPVEPPDEHAEEVDVIRLTVDDQSINITASGTNEDITIPVGETALSATFLDEDGEEVELHDDEFELRITSDDTSIATYDAIDAFSGTLTGVGAGNTDVSVELYHLEEGHADFGPHDVNVIVQ